MPRYDEHEQKVPYAKMFKRSQPVLAVRGIQQAVCINLYIKDGQSSINHTRNILKGWGGGEEINNRRNILVKCIQYYFLVLQNRDQSSIYMIV